MQKNKNMIIIIIVSIIILFIGCKSINVQLDTNLEYFDNNIIKLIFETNPGCSKRDFNITEEFQKSNNTMTGAFVAKTYEEYENTIKKYFEMEYLETIVEEYFNEKNLIIILLSAHDSEYYKNGRFEKDENNNFIYMVGLYKRANPLLMFNKCVYSKIFIYEMNK